MCLRPLTPAEGQNRVAEAKQLRERVQEGATAAEREAGLTGIVQFVNAVGRPSEPFVVPLLPAVLKALAEKVRCLHWCLYAVHGLRRRGDLGGRCMRSSNLYTCVVYETIYFFLLLTGKYCLVSAGRLREGCCLQGWRCRHGKFEPSRYQGCDATLVGGDGAWCKATDQNGSFGLPVNLG